MPTDDELFEIGRRAYGIRPADYKNKLEGLAAERRALYEAGVKFATDKLRKLADGHEQAGNTVEAAGFDLAAAGIERLAGITGEGQ